MALTRKEYAVPSTSGLCNIFIESYIPDENTPLKGIIQLAHGMCEHHERYDEFAEFLNNHGYVVFINDHLGFGKSIASYNDLGYFGEKDGYIHLVEDLKQVTDIAKKEYPNLPLILFGHSMGSFLARLYTEKYPDELTAVAYCGTAGLNPACDMGIAVCNVIASVKGGHYRSKFIKKLAFGSYLKRIKNPRTEEDWLSKNEPNIDKYIADPKCGGLLTARGYRDLFTLHKTINRLDWYTSFPLDLPILLVAGEEDPVGSWGKGVKEVYEKLVEANHTDVQINLFPGDRHEILQELDRADVFEYILKWFDDKIAK